MADKTLIRIAALLRQAEGTDNEHEAEAFMAAAQRLATLESVDLALARSHTAAKERRKTPEQRTISIGEAGKRGLGTYVQLFVAIAGANEVTCDVARNSTYVYAYGFGEDIDVCEALYSSLVVQMVAACERFLRSGTHRAELVWGRDRGRWVQRPVHATTARINFQNAFAVEVGSRLQHANQQARSEAEQRLARQAADEAAGGSAVPVDAAAGTTLGRSSSVAVALRAKELEITDFYQRTSQARGSWRGSSAGYSESSQRAGKRAGKQAQLGRRTAIGGQRKALR